VEFNVVVRFHAPFGITGSGAGVADVADNGVGPPGSTDEELLQAATPSVSIRTMTVGRYFVMPFPPEN
jgi:hypothetical protein